MQFCNIPVFTHCLWFCAFMEHFSRFKIRWKQCTMLQQLLVSYVINLTFIDGILWDIYIKTKSYTAAAHIRRKGPFHIYNLMQILLMNQCLSSTLLMYLREGELDLFFLYAAKLFNLYQCIRFYNLIVYLMCKINLQSNWKIQLSNQCRGVKSTSHQYLLFTTGNVTSVLIPPM